MMITNDTRRVPYNIPGSPYWQWVSIYTRLSQERIIFLNQPLTDGVANSVISALLYLESDDNKKPISLYINSIGDPLDMGMGDISAGLVSVVSGLAIYDTIQYIKAEVTTICLGQAVGMAALLLAAGTKGKRVSLPHAEIVLTSAKTGTQGQASDIEVNATEVLDKRALVLEILAKETGQTVERIKKDSDRSFYLSPTQAQEYGIIDRVLETSKL
jgi:ATP-dependent Clp protease protease subunit